MPRNTKGTKTENAFLIITISFMLIMTAIALIQHGPSEVNRLINL